ncbi:MAG TPA: dUTP diphosphatase [Polyangia bacterium]|nr:dUTP diphosphatase [Polyangia bacterium]
MSAAAPTIRFVKLRPDAAAPRYMSEGAAGLDLASASPEPIEIPPGGRAAVPTGLAFEIPRGFEGQVRGRSGLARKFGIGLPNAPGTIDSDYRGEVVVLLINWGTEPFVVNTGDRVAQLIIAPVVTAELEEAADLADSKRGAGGFGHTGQ